MWDYKMDKKYLTDLYEYIGSATNEQSLVSKIANIFALEKESVTNLIESLDFADYVELTNVVNSGDKRRIRHIIGKNMEPTQESANSYAASTSVSQPAAPQTNEPMQQNDNGSNFSTNVDVDELQDKDTEDGVSKTDEDGLEEELNRLRALSGIGEGQATTTGRITSTTPSFLNSAAIAGAVMPKNKMKKLTKSPSAKKPGPKTK